MTTIMGVRLDNRLETAVEFQKVLTKFGCIIKTRLGLHEVSEKQCAHNGIILMELTADSEAGKFQNELAEIEGLEIQIMKFE